MNDVQYAVTEDGTHIAYRVLEADHWDGAPHDIVMVSGGLIPMELFEEELGFARLLAGLQALGRVVVFDRRGLGLSDPIVDWEQPVLDQWADDLAAVVIASGVRDPVVFAWDTYGVGTRFAARHSDQVGRFVLYEPIIVTEGEWEDWSSDQLRAIQANISGEFDILERIAPSRVADPTFREWYSRAGRLGASPATAGRIFKSAFGARPEAQLLEGIKAPTLVLHRRDSAFIPPESAMIAAERIPNATAVELDGEDLFPFMGDVDAVLAEIADFVVGERRLPPPERVLAAVMFTDLVGSTERAASVGDAKWKSMLDRHDAAVRAAVGRCGGRVIKTTGDGVLALFPSTAGALNTALRLPAHLVEDDLQVRVGIHVGDVDRRGDDVSGLAVNIAARVMARAGDGNVAVTASVVAAMAGQAAAFEPIGSHTLKGIPGEWELFQVVDGTVTG
ncbi:MAG: adenylate/guanylate cyclase domain-containing protein [Acidimicrobiia bacterium]